MRVEVNDFVIAQVSEKKRGLVLVTNKVSDKEFEVVLNNVHLADKGKRTMLHVSPKEIIANLGKTPPIGMSAFGVKIEPILSIGDSEFGKVHYQATLDEKELNHITKCLTTTYKLMEDYQLIENFPINVFIKNGQQGRTKFVAGRYSYKGDKGMDDMMVSVGNYIYTSFYLLHELGHHIWFRYMNSEQKSKWVLAYKKMVEIENVGMDTLVELRKRFVSEKPETMSEFVVELDTRDREVFKKILKWVKANHHLSASDLLLLLNTDFDFKSVWPDSMCLSKFKTEISAYASTKVEELFAEAWAHFHFAMEIPDYIKNLLDQTLYQISAKHLKPIKAKFSNFDAVMAGKNTDTDEGVTESKETDKKSNVVKLPVGKSKPKVSVTSTKPTTGSKGKVVQIDSKKANEKTKVIIPASKIPMRKVVKK